MVAEFTRFYLKAPTLYVLQIFDKMLNAYEV